jgi:hypothetical protein
MNVRTLKLLGKSTYDGAEQWLRPVVVQIAAARYRVLSRDMRPCRDYWPAESSEDAGACRWCGMTAQQHEAE